MWFCLCVCVRACACIHAFVCMQGVYMYSVSSGFMCMCVYVCVCVCVCARAECMYIPVHSVAYRNGVIMTVASPKSRVCVQPTLRSQVADLVQSVRILHRGTSNFLMEKAPSLVSLDGVCVCV